MPKLYHDALAARMSSGILGAVDGVVVKGVGVALQNVLSFEGIRTLYSRVTSEFQVEVQLACSMRRMWSSWSCNRLVRSSQQHHACTLTFTSRVAHKDRALLGIHVAMLRMG